MTRGQSRCFNVSRPTKAKPAQPPSWTICSCQQPCNTVDSVAGLHRYAGIVDMNSFIPTTTRQECGAGKDEGIHSSTLNDTESDHLRCSEPNQAQLFP